MRLTRYTDYALRVLIYLGLQPERLGTIREIAEAYGISENHLMKVVQHLGAQGYIETMRGRSGGLRLARAPEGIRIGDVVRKMEQEMALVECFDDRTNTCPITGACELQRALGRALKAFFGVLDEYSLAMLLKPSRRMQVLLRMEIVAGK